MYYLPTYDECLSLCDKDGMVFYESKVVIDGYNISLFNYRLAVYNDFISTPFAKEMRGICFVFNTDGTLYKRFLLLNKFFNLNQVPETLYSVVKDYEIVDISTKEDGSVASFIELPNGKIVGRTKMGFDNDQSMGINRVYNNNEVIKNFVRYCIDNNYVPIFEYVAPFNRIVLRYPKEELILLKVRDNNTGEYLPLDRFDGRIKWAEKMFTKMSLDELINYTETLTDCEGFIVNCLNDEGNLFMFKLKTPWYFSLHGLLTEDIYKENILIGNIINDTIDDIISQIPEDEIETHDKINEMISVVRSAISNKVKEVKKEYKFFESLGFDRKEYSLNHRNGNENFSFVMSMYNGFNVYDLVKDYFLKRTNKLEKARTWLNEL